MLIIRKNNNYYDPKYAFTGYKFYAIILIYHLFIYFIIYIISLEFFIRVFQDDPLVT